VTVGEEQTEVRLLSTEIDAGLQTIRYG